MNRTHSVGEFDYIIVGAGSAGCVLANRLSADGTRRVLLLEAGPPDRNPWIHVPIGYGRLFKDPSVNWMYRTEPQDELHSRAIFTPRGKVLGGSSSINGLIYIRGQREDFDAWRDLGNVGWGWDDVLPYFRKAENQQRGADAWHGTEGPLAVSDPRESHSLCDAFIAAAEQAGHRRNLDFNGEHQEGAGYFQTTTRRARRVSAAAGYLRPARSRRNLHVLTGVLVTRVLLDEGQAIGVEWLRGKVRQQARASGEVILSAGAINTPQLLQLSGIGNAAMLRALGIGVIHHAPDVGANLQDHLQVRLIYRAARPITVNDALRRWPGKIGAGLNYLVRRKGPLTVSAGYAGGFFSSPLSPERPDIQAHFITFSADAMGDRLHDFSGFTVSSCQLRPESRGSVTIRSSDPRDPPAIDPRYFTAEADRVANVEGVKLLRRIMSAPAMRALVAEEIEPGPAITDDAAILAYCRQHASTLYHPTCTARMGPDDAAVVDAQLRVRGVDHLRVVDGSVMPRLPSGNTNAAIIMIAEKAADLILAAGAAISAKGS